MRLFRVLIIGFIVVISNQCATPYYHNALRTTPKDQLARLIPHPFIELREIDGTHINPPKIFPQFYFETGTYSIKFDHQRVAYIDFGLDSYVTAEITLEAGNHYYICPHYAENQFGDPVSWEPQLMLDNRYEPPNTLIDPAKIDQVPPGCRGRRDLLGP